MYISSNLTLVDGTVGGSADIVVLPSAIADWRGGDIISTPSGSEFSLFGVLILFVCVTMFVFCVSLWCINIKNLCFNLVVLVCVRVWNACVRCV